MSFMDDLNDMFNKSAAVAGDMLNKGASAAGRMADSANLRFKQGEIDRRWKDACAALGESVIEAVKADPALLSGREKMMADLDAIAKERADVADELQRIAAETEAARRAGRVKTCPECGGEVGIDAKFCMHCGYPMPIDVQPEPAAAVSTEAESGNATAAENAAQSEVEVTEGAPSSEASDAPKAEANAASECKAE